MLSLLAALGMQFCFVCMQASFVPECKVQKGYIPECKMTGISFGETTYFHPLLLMIVNRSYRQMKRQWLVLQDI